MHYTTLKYTTLHCDALHCDTLHCTDALHNKKERHSLINIVIYVHCDDNAHMFLFPCWFPFLGLVGHSSNISSLGFRCTNSGFKARQYLQAIHYGKSEPWLLRLFLGRVWSLPHFPQAILSCIIFCFWTPKSDKKWKSHSFVRKTFLMQGPLCNQTVLRGCAPQDSLITLGTSLGKKKFQATLRLYHCFSQRIHSIIAFPYCF